MPRFVLCAIWQLICRKEWKVEMIQQSKFFVSKLFGFGKDTKSVRTVLQHINASEEKLANISEHPHSDSTIRDHSFLNFIDVLGMQTADRMFLTLEVQPLYTWKPRLSLHFLSGPRNCFIVSFILSLHFCCKVCKIILVRQFQ